MFDPSHALSASLSSLGFGGVLGAAVGFTAKKTLKIAAIVVGLSFIAVQLLLHFGLLHVDWGAIESASHHAWVDASGETAAARAWAVLSADLPFGTAFVAGFALGFRLG